jgi:hypothetical protein
VRLEVVGPFTTVVTAHGDSHRIVGVPGDVLSVDETVAAALFREVAPYVREIPPEQVEVILSVSEFPLAETSSSAVVVEMVEVPAEVVAPPKVARTRQVARKPAPRKKAKP